MWVMSGMVLASLWQYISHCLMCSFSVVEKDPDTHFNVPDGCLDRTTDLLQVSLKAVKLLTYGEAQTLSGEGQVIMSQWQPLLPI